MKVLLSILCAGKDPYKYMENSNNVNEIIKSIIANGMLKRYQNANSQIKSGMRVNWRILLHSSNLTQHEILKINMDNIPPIDFIDLIQGYCDRDFTVQSYFIQTCFDKIDISQLTNEDKKELLEMYALMFAE
ncbi:MAG: hypothetical protein K6E76_01115 [Patescibacteria group bacterium]|nr:hypothetical protein [Patescibacteria group bacterium]